MVNFMEQKTEIIPSTIQLKPVMPLISAQEAKQAWQKYEELKAAVLDETDYQEISNKRYIKRSGFRKLAVFFGISDIILNKERIEKPNGNFTWRIDVEAKAPNGRTAIGVGACDSTERGFAHLEHDVYSTAHTRAKSRAISDLVAGGALSAEEVETEQSTPNKIIDMQPSTKTAKLADNKHLNIDPETLELLTTATEIKDERLKQYPLKPEANIPVGMINVLDDVTAIVPYQANLRKDHTALTNFLFQNILEKTCTKHNCEYEVVSTQEGALLYILIKGKLEEESIKGLLTSTRWAFLKANETNNKDNQPPT